jgi:hypothetical protein
LTNVARFGTSAAMAISSVSSFIKQAKDDSVEWTDKLVTGTMAFSMSIAAIMQFA